MLAMQSPLTQSIACWHIFPTAQAGQVPPPQSTSVSKPFWTMSVQVGAGWQVPPMQIVLWQSPPLPHVLPSAQRSEEHTSELQSLAYLVCRLLLEKKKKKTKNNRLQKKTKIQTK